MDRDKILIFADHLARFYAEKYGFAPVTGRLIGYLAVCQPMEQPIKDIAEALFTSRSAINEAIKTLENLQIVRRTRLAGTRADLISLNPLDSKNTGFDPSEYVKLAALGREGLELLKNASPERREPLETMVSMNEFMAEKIPKLYDEWMEYHQPVKNKETGMNNFLKKVIGEIEDKKEWTATQKRAKALPGDYRAVYDEIQKYIMEGGAGIVGTIKPFKRLVDIFEEGAAAGKHVLEITGDDVAAFADKLVQDEEPDAEDWREQMNREIVKETEDWHNQLNRNLSSNITKKLKK